MQNIPDQVKNSLQSLESYLDKYGLAGYDPYDALNSRFIHAVSRHSRILRLVFTQFLKRFPVNFRPLLGVKKGFNPKGMGLFLSAYLKLYSIYGDSKYIKKAEEIIEFLKSTHSEGYSGFCWGYNFDWQSETDLTPKYTPTIVNTVFIADALLDAYDIIKKKEYLDMARSACDFILNDLYILHSSQGICFSYTPLDPIKIHNANVLGGALLARVYSYSREKILQSMAKLSVEYTMFHQNPDGSWYYGVSKKNEGLWKKGNKSFQDEGDSGYVKYIDGYHTGFVLDSLWAYTAHTKDNIYRKQIKKGLQFYAEHFFLNDGTPKYFFHKTYPVDIHSIQAVITFSKLYPLQPYDELMHRVIKWSINQMQDAAGYFYYRKGKFWKNKIPYIRWSQAWAFLALSTYIKFLGTRKNDN